jgi:hypothetical protein
MKKEEIEKIIALRTKLIREFNILRDYKSNPNAIMKEFDHASLLHATIRDLDEILGENVNFTN